VAEEKLVFLGFIMIAHEENKLLTQTGRGMPMGELLRRYWQPVALSDELPDGKASLPLKVMGEELVVFRDDQGRPGLLGIHCAHRGADLSYGRVEDGGLRCIYHGWLYDIHGKCLDQPGEPGAGAGRDQIRHLAYPCQEKAGLIFAYMGSGEPPLLPCYEALIAPEDQTAVLKAYHECNFLQGNEGNIDPVHLSFLHRQFEEGDHSGWDLGVRGSSASSNAFHGRDPSPNIEVEITDFGVRIVTIRSIGEKKNYVRVSNFVMPNLSAVPAGTGADGYNINWAVPIDDTHHWKVQLSFRRSAPIDKQAFRKRNAAGLTPDFRLIRNKGNRYLQDREEMKTKTYSGMGSFFPAHDAFATESQGAIQDRTREHLTSTDQAIVAERKLLLKGIGDILEGKDPQHIMRESDKNFFPHLQVISAVFPESTNLKELFSKVG
jgi:phthalate 4,5-dioxygenase